MANKSMPFESQQQYMQFTRIAFIQKNSVLKLENGKEEGRFGKPILTGNNSVQFNSDIDYVK